MSGTTITFLAMAASIVSVVISIYALLAVKFKNNAPDTEYGCNCVNCRDKRQQNK